MSGTVEVGMGAGEAGAPLSAGERTFAGAAIDSRKVAGGELFFALAGAHTDGHRFVGDALARGAAAAVVDEPGLVAPEGGVLIRVANGYRALHDLTRHLRREVPRRLVGLTGSVGKTTTKELLAAMLGRRFRVAKSPGNLNNRLGFPLALAGIPDDTEWMVAEMGMSVPGELAEVSRLARPDAALLLNVRPVHLENFASLAAIAEAKAEILAGLPADGLLVANADDPEVVRVARRHPGRIVWFGAGESADVRASRIEPLGPGEAGAPRPGTRFHLAVRRADGHVEERAIELALHGAYNVWNCLAAAACAYALGVSLDNIAAAAAHIAPAAGRGVLHPLPGGGTLIDDSYNSNPAALAEALASAASLTRPRRHWAVLGDMLELGPNAPDFHHDAGAQAARLGFSPIAGVGELSRHLVAGATTAALAPATGSRSAPLGHVALRDPAAALASPQPESGGGQAPSGGRRAQRDEVAERAEPSEAPRAGELPTRRWFATAAEAAAWAMSELQPGDVVLVKGSRGIGLDLVVEHLLAAARAQGVS